MRKKENFEFKPDKLRLKIDLVSYPARADGVGKYDMNARKKERVNEWVEKWFSARMRGYMNSFKLQKLKQVEMLKLIVKLEV